MISTRYVHSRGGSRTAPWGLDIFIDLVGNAHPTMGPHAQTIPEPSAGA
jgi:hypothetical protein